MRPTAFALEMPETLEEVLALAEKHGDEAVVLAGGQTLIPLLNMRIVRPNRLIDLSGVRSLEGIDLRGDEIGVGAMVRQVELEASEIVQESAPLLRHVARFVGQIQTRSRGTVGGSVALGSSVGELCVTLVALGGRVKVDRRTGSHWVDASSFFKDYLTTALEPGEIITEIGFPIVGPSMRWGFSELKVRSCDFPIVVAVAVLRFDGEVCADAHVAVGGVAPTPVRVRGVESELIGRPLDYDAVRRAASAIAGDVAPVGDLHAPAEYRTRVAVREVTSALRLAVGRAAR